MRSNLIAPLPLFVGPALARCAFACVDKPDDPFHVVHGVRNASGHCGRDAKALMDAAEIINDEIERQRVNVRAE